MAEQLTWKEKLEKGLPLTELEQVKYDAERITLRRIEENKEEQRVAEERKVAKYGNPNLPKQTPVQADVQPENSKKGN
jgi:hypothetical protein